MLLGSIKRSLRAAANLTQGRKLVKFPSNIIRLQPWLNCRLQVVLNTLTFLHQNNNITMVPQIKTMFQTVYMILGHASGMYEASEVAIPETHNYQ